MEEPGKSGHKACLRCGKIMAAEASFCNTCGADLRAAPVPGMQGAVDPYDFRGFGAPGAAPGMAARPAAYSVPPPPSMGVVAQRAQTVPLRTTTAAGRPYVPGYERGKTDGLAIVSITCAIASFVVLPFIAAIAAIATGSASRERIRKSEGRLEGDGLALAGILVGVLNLVLCLVVLLLIIAAVISP